MTDKAKQLVSLYVQDVVQDSMPQFEDALMNNVTPEMSKDQVYVKMILNAVTLSTDLATQIILDLLDSTDVLSITSDEKVLQKLALRLHTDNLKKEFLFADFELPFRGQQFFFLTLEIFFWKSTPLHISFPVTSPAVS